MRNPDMSRLEMIARYIERNGPVTLNSVCDTLHCSQVSTTEENLKQFMGHRVIKTRDGKWRKAWIGQVATSRIVPAYKF